MTTETWDTAGNSHTPPCQILDTRKNPSGFM